jgi:tetratricopeptide (TPR) repeat protein
VVNVLLQCGCALALWRVLRALQIPGAWLGAALWALHPVQAESVAWIAEMKNTESGLFYLLSIHFFLRGLKRVGRDDLLCLLFAGLAMTAKSSTVVLPLILLLCTWWSEGRWQREHFFKVAPIFLMSLVMGLISTITQKSLGEYKVHWNGGLWQQLALAGDGIWFYLGKLAWPVPLMMVYPKWQVSAEPWTGLALLLAALAGLLLFWLNRRRWGRPCFFAGAYFLLALLPVLGFFNLNYFAHSFVADHFQFLAGMGPLALVGAGVVKLKSWTAEKAFWLTPALGAGLMIFLGSLTWNRGWVFRDQISLWTDTLGKNPACVIGYNNLGFQLAMRGEEDAAIAQYRHALALDPRNALAYSNLGAALTEKNEPGAALAACRKAVELDPGLGLAHGNLGNVLAETGQLDEAMAQYMEALRTDPYDANTFNNLGNIDLQKGNVEAAIAQFRQALALNPGFSSIHFNLGNALLQKGDAAAAIPEYQEALRLTPDLAPAQANLAKAEALAAKQPPVR